LAAFLSLGELVCLNSLVFGSFNSDVVLGVDFLFVNRFCFTRVFNCTVFLHTFAEGDNVFIELAGVDLSLVVLSVDVFPVILELLLT
jgi:hypothetical protein